MTTIPIVLCCAGNDPSGGAGLSADIESCISLGAHACPVVTSLTVQNTQGVTDFEPVKVSTFIEQIRSVLDDSVVSAIKIGMVASVEIVEAIYTVLRDIPTIPVVLDPVILSSSGHALARSDLIEAMKSLLFPSVTVLTPNRYEARSLAPNADNLNACAQAIMAMGCEHVLITGADESNDEQEVINTLFGNRRIFREFRWPKINDEFHGTGCTLASAIAALLAQGCNPVTAVQEAQKYSLACIQHAKKTGKGRLVPNRLYWTKK